jgi:D-aspartate ligase
MSDALDYTTPAVILQSGHHGALGIVRSLGRLGVPVYCIDGARWQPAFSSRYCKARFVVNVETAPPAQSVAALLEISRRLSGRPALIPTTDLAAIWLADHAAFLESAFRFQKQDAELVRTLCDKGRMQDLALRNGIPVAQSLIPRSTKDLERFLETANFPVMVKATDAARVRARAGGTKFVVRSSQNLLDLYARVGDLDEPGLMIQEFIPGEDWMFNGCFDDASRCIFGVTGKKIRRFPVNTGVTSLGVCLRNDMVEKQTAAFMKAIGYRGILDIGYRYDRRVDQYKVLDVNPRIGCTFRLFTATNGMDVARAFYLNLTGQAVVPAKAHEGRKWIVEDFDLYSALRSLTGQGLSVEDWMRSFRGIQEAACFAPDDPVPFLLMPAADCFELYRWFRHR